MSNIYQFPQGEEKAQVKAAIARIRNAPVVEKRKRWLWRFCRVCKFFCVNGSIA